MDKKDIENDDMKLKYYIYIGMNSVVSLEDAIDLDIKSFEEFCMKNA